MDPRNMGIAAAVMAAGLWAAGPANADPAPPPPGHVQHALDQAGTAADKVGSAADRVGEAADDAATDAVLDETVWPALDAVDMAGDALSVLDWATD